MNTHTKVDVSTRHRLAAARATSHHGRMRPAWDGFTLMEMMVAVAIIAILASIALPNYTQFLRESRRADAMLALQQIQIEQEKLRAECTSYAATLTGTRACGVLGYPKSTSPDDFYNLTLSGVTATGYTATATATGSQASDTSCPSLVLQVDGLVLNRTPTQCWKR